MLDKTTPTLTMQVNAWLEAFEAALSSGDRDAIADLFVADAFWRDAVAFTWRLTTFRGSGNIAAELAERSVAVAGNDFQVDEGRTAPRWVDRAGTECLEGIFHFKTAVGSGDGIVRLVATSDEDGEQQSLKAWTILTALEALDGFEETLGERRPTGDAYSRDFRRRRANC